MPKPLIIAVLLVAAWYAWSEHGPGNGLPTAGQDRVTVPGKVGSSSPARTVGAGAERAAGKSSP